MNWDFIQGNYVTNNISIAASTLIRNPTDMASFSEPKYLDGSTYYSSTMMVHYAYFKH